MGGHERGVARGNIQWTVGAFGVGLCAYSWFVISDTRSVEGLLLASVDQL